MSVRDQTKTFRPDIEGLRGIAILLVVLFHCDVPGLSGGFVGVDVFFVLSGFLITGMLVDEIQRTSKLSLLQFYARRVRRLLPASVLALVATLLMGAILLAPRELEWAGHAGQAAALYMSNIFFDKNAGDYFGPDLKFNPLLHTWSLAVEEQFYVFWPLLIVVSMRYCRSRAGLVSALAGLTMISFGVGLWFTLKGGTFAFYELPARAWEFGVGGLAALLPRKMLKLPVGWWLAVGWLGLLAIFGMGHFFITRDDTSFPGWVALIPTMGTVAVLVAWSEHPHRGVGVVLASAPLQLIGRFSYSWYLWHWPFLVFAVALVPTISIVGKVTAAIAALAVAGLSYYFIENPIRYHPSLLKRPVLSVCLAGAVTTCLLGAALLSIRFSMQLTMDPHIKAITAAIDDISRLPRGQCVTSKQSAEVKTCEFGNKRSEISVILFGDSHAIQWFNPLERLAESNGWRLTTVVKSACSAFDVTLAGDSAEQIGACAKWREDALAQIVAMRPTVVFLGNATGVLAKDPRNPVSLEDVRDGTRRTLQALKGLRVAIMRDGPVFPYDIPTCLARSSRHSWYPDGACEANRLAVLNPAVFEAEKAGALGLADINFIDMTDHLCQKDVCRPNRGDTVIYRDHQHLTGDFADSLVESLATELLPLVKASPRRSLTPVESQRPRHNSHNTHDS